MLEKPNFNQTRIVHKDLLEMTYSSSAKNAAGDTRSIAMFMTSQKEMAIWMKDFVSKMPREEQKHLSLLISGNRNTERWNSIPKKSDFFFAKGTVSSVLQKLGLNQLQYTPTTSDLFSEGLSISTRKKKIVDFLKYSLHLNLLYNYPS